jgi:DNA-binding transcriptional LysR family regulator
VETSIELWQLRYFVAVAEELHFGRAAERLHMSQSPLSRAIRELEGELGLVLFVRTTRRVELTPAGLLLLERARRALDEIDGAVADARRFTRSGDGSLRLGHGPFSGAAASRCEFVAEPVLVPREQAGEMLFNAWLRSVMRAHGFELEQTTEIASAPWDRRLPPGRWP